MRKLTLLAVALMVALVAVPASASVQNIKISGDINSAWLMRDNFDLGFGSGSLNPSGDLVNGSDQTQNLFFTQTTLQVDADLTDNVSATVGLINERAWDQSAAANTDVDLYLAYATLREMLYSPLTVVIGRQVFSYGNSLVVDATGTNNTSNADAGLGGIATDLTAQTSLDAIRLIFDYNPLTLELLYSKIDANTLGSAVDDSDDIDLFGVNASYDLGDDMDTQVEAYFFGKVDKSTNDDPSDSTNVGTKSDTVYVPGLRVSTNPIEGLNVQGEFALQRGTKVVSTASAINNQNRKAMAAQFMANYKVPVVEEYNPLLAYTFTYVSGDSNPTDANSGHVYQVGSDNWTAWDPMFEGQGGGTIYSSIFDLSNLLIHNVSLTANPMEDVTTTFSWSGLWLDKKIETGDTITARDPGSATTNALVATSDTELGHEFDLIATYDYTEDVQIGANLGWFVAGDALGRNNDSTAKQALVNVNVSF